MKILLPLLLLLAACQPIQNVRIPVTEGQTIALLAGSQLDAFDTNPRDGFLDGPETQAYLTWFAAQLLLRWTATPPTQ